MTLSASLMAICIGLSLYAGILNVTIRKYIKKRPTRSLMMYTWIFQPDTLEPEGLNVRRRYLIVLPLTFVFFVAFLASGSM